MGIYLNSLWARCQSLRFKDKAGTRPCRWGPEYFPLVELPMVHEQHERGSGLGGWQRRKALPWGSIPAPGLGLALIPEAAF